MHASDIMSTPVISVAPDTPVKDIAALLFEKRISGVPVLDEGRLVGLVSEGDLLRRHEIGTERAKRGGSWWLRMFGADQTPAEYVKAHGRRAQDVMTREVLTIMPDTPVAEIATLLESRGIKRLPVMRDGQLVGIVSRANLVQAACRHASRRGARHASRGPGDSRPAPGGARAPVLVARSGVQCHRHRRRRALLRHGALRRSAASGPDRRREHPRGTRRRGSPRALPPGRRMGLSAVRRAGTVLLAAAMFAGLVACSAAPQVWC